MQHETNRVIPISTVRLGAAEERLVLEVLRSGHLAQGECVERFERLFAAEHGVAHAVAVNNGTTALVAALQTLGVGPGDEVITSPFTFVATLNAILEVGAVARFADIGADFNVAPDATGALVSARSCVLLPVHLYGYMADMTALTAIADRHGLPIVEDAAQAVGAEYQGRKAGSFGLGCFSLYATKNITTGEGGVVTTNDAGHADLLRVLRNQGMRARYEYVMAGHNYRMTDLQAAIGIPQLERYEQSVQARRQHAAALREGLDGIDGLVLPTESAERSHVYHQFTVRVTAEARTQRDDFVEQLRVSGVGCGVYYPKVVFDYDCYRSNPNVLPDDVPNAFVAAREVVSLPVHAHLTDADVSLIIRAVRALLT